MKKIENIVLHCSDSLWGCAREIRKWHLERGWKDIGYHFVIMNGRPGDKDFYIPTLDGSVECGRPLDGDMYVEPNELGSHVLGMNDRSVGICLIGVNQFSPIQFASMICLLRNLCSAYGLSSSAVIGHYETESGKEQGKTCPNFDVSKIRGELEAALQKKDSPCIK